MEHFLLQPEGAGLHHRADLELGPAETWDAACWAASHGRLCSGMGTKQRKTAGGKDAMGQVTAGQ
jgi:hypothetical protein